MSAPEVLLLPLPLILLLLLLFLLLLLTSTLLRAMLATTETVFHASHASTHVPTPCPTCTHTSLTGPGYDASSEGREMAALAMR